MSYLRINHHIISKREYQATKQILDILNKTINLYSKNQASNIFNIRKFAKFVSETKYLSDSSKKLIDCDNCLIKDFRDKLKCNIIVTFFAYTPLIFVEIFLKILYFLGLFFVKFQIFRLKKTGLEFINLNKDFASINTSKKEFKF